MSLIISGVLLAISIFMNLFQTETAAMALNWVVRAFAGVIFFESMMMYYKILKVLKMVVQEVTTKTVVISIATYVMNFVGFCTLGLNTTMSFALILSAIILRTLYKVNTVDARLKG